MDGLFTPIANLNASELDKLADLHCAVMQTLLTELGKPLVRRYYEIVQHRTEVIGLCAMTPAGEMLAWAAGCPAPSKLTRQLRQPLPWFVGQIARLAVTRPRVLIDLAGSVLHSSSANEIQAGEVELTYIGVAAAAQGQGIGKRILSAFLDSSRNAGYRSVALTVEQDNHAAIKLYSHSGFEIAHSFREGRFERYRMRYIVTHKA